jgi:hypothetical protein
MSKPGEFDYTGKRQPVTNLAVKMLAKVITSKESGDEVVIVSHKLKSNKETEQQ